MKQIILALMIVSVSATFIACVANEPPAPPEETSPPAVTESETPESDGEIAQITPAQSVYRGVVTEAQSSTDGNIYILKQATGSDYGSPTLKVILSQEAKDLLENDELTVGTYMEISYTQEPEQALSEDKLYTAHYAKNLSEVEFVNFNGVVIQNTPDPETPDKGQLLMQDMANNQEVVFNYSAETSFIPPLGKSQIAPGDKLNIFHRGAYTRSIPPQGSAIEVRAYTEAKPEV